jgi:hypothetical protein
MITGHASRATRPAKPSPGGGEVAVACALGPRREQPGTPGDEAHHRRMVRHDEPPGSGVARPNAPAQRASRPSHRDAIARPALRDALRLCSATATAGHGDGEVHSSSPKAAAAFAPRQTPSGVPASRARPARRPRRGRGGRLSRTKCPSHEIAAPHTRFGRSFAWDQRSPAHGPERHRSNPDRRRCAGQVEQAAPSGAISRHEAAA